MPCVIRKIVGDRYENFVELAPTEWQLCPQIEALQDWLSTHRTDLNPAFEWIADIGFCVRSDRAWRRACFFEGADAVVYRSEPGCLSLRIPRPGRTRFLASQSIGRTAKSEEIFLRNA